MNIVWSRNSAQTKRNLQMHTIGTVFPFWGEWGGGRRGLWNFWGFCYSQCGPTKFSLCSHWVLSGFSTCSQVPVEFPNIWSIAHHFVTYALHSIVLLEPKWANSGTYMWSEYFNIRGFESFRTFFGPMKEADCKKKSELVMNPQLININHNNYP
jgi:hypothetical protein